MEWIDVKDALPGEEKEVMAAVTMDGERFLCPVMWIENGAWNKAQDFGPGEWEVTHWMEYPELPRKEISRPE